MPIPRLHVHDTTLMVIDVQERLLPSIPDGARVAWNCRQMVRAANELEVPVLMTEQYVKGLGRTVDEVAAGLTNPAARIEKTRFSAAIGMVLEQIHAWRRSTVLVCGLEAHVCVLQTVLDLQASGRQCFVLTDAISSGQRDQVAPALDRMQAAGAVLTGVVSAMYELMGDATHPAFRRCLEIAKDIRA